MKKSLLITIFAILLVSVFAFALSLDNQPINENPNEVSIKYSSNVCRQVIRVDGSVEPVECNHNVLHNSGMNLIRDMLGDTGGASDEVDQIFLCNASAGCGTPSAGATELFIPFSGCGLTATTGDYSVRTGEGNWTMATTFTASCDDLVTNVTRLKNSAGVNFSSVAFATTTLQSLDTILINWTLTAS